MIIREICEERRFEALDRTRICELLHPDRENLEIPYSLAHAVLAPGQESLPHRLMESSEVYYILQGEGRMYIDDEAEMVGPGRAVLIPPGSCQHIKNMGKGELKFLCIVYPRWRIEDEVCERGE